MKTQTPKLFIQLTTGGITTDNSKGRNTRCFNKHDFKLWIRPHLIQCIQTEVIHNVGEEPLYYSEVLISGIDYPVLSLNSPAEIMEMIEAIELPASTFVGNIDESLLCSHDAMAINTNGVSVCQYCGKEFI